MGDLFRRVCPRRRCSSPTSNTLQPLIRYEITDQVVLLNQACSCGSAHRRVADIQGRLDDEFAYDDGMRVHPRMCFARC